jgi:hypothetical protein
MELKYARVLMRLTLYFQKARFKLGLQSAGELRRPRGFAGAAYQHKRPRAFDEGGDEFLNPHFTPEDERL